MAFALSGDAEMQPTDLVPSCLPGLLGASLWELFWVVLSVAIAIIVAIGFGDKLLARAGEQRRLHEWAIVGELVRHRLHLAIGRATIQSLVRAAFTIPTAPNDVTDKRYFRQWAMRLSAIRMRQGDADVLTVDHFRDDDEDIHLLRGIAVLSDVMRGVHQQLMSILLSFPDAIPTALRRSLANAVLRLEEFVEAVHPLGQDPEEKTDERKRDIQLSQNCYFPLRAFEALDELGDAIRAATPVWQKKHEAKPQRRTP